VFGKHISDNGLPTKINKEFLKLNNNNNENKNKLTNPEKWAEFLKNISQKKMQ
jgi:hypothetical protein